MGQYNITMNEICDIAEELKDNELIALAKFLRQRINNPDAYLMFLGETCSGKSTLINSIVGSEILPVSGVPLTGSITEIVFDETVSEDKYYAINKNATMEPINEALFKKLSVEPDDKLERLRLVTNNTEKSYNGLKLFDTPGYGSLVKEHSEVLYDFLPNADAIAYVVQYKEGFQEEDYEFLKCLFELTREGVPFYLLINRCPTGTQQSDVRVQEIYNYVQGLLQQGSVPLVLIDSDVEDNSSAISKAMNGFMNTAVSELNSDRRKEELNNAFEGYILELITRIKAELEKRINSIEMDEEQKRVQEEAVKNLTEKFDKAISEIVIPGFDKLIDTFPHRVEESRERLEDSIIGKIDEQSVVSKDETVAYVRTHLLNYYPQKEVQELQFYLENEIEAMDKKVDEYLNTAIIQFESDLKLANPSAVYKAGVNVLKGFGSKLVDAGLLSYFAKYGGAGGAGAGVANAASHALKKFGDFFGKTFKKKTHEAVQKLVKLLKLTNSKAIGGIASAIVDTVVLVVDISTWKLKLRSEVKKGIKKWSDDFDLVGVEEIRKLKNTNIENINDMKEATKKTFSTEDTVSEGDISIDNLKEYMDKLSQLESEVA